MAKKVVTELYLNGMTPQKAIRHLTDLINRTKQEEKRWLRIETYKETFSHPFRDGVEALRLVIDKPELKES
jgi:hypothetical protein